MCVISIKSVVYLRCKNLSCNDVCDFYFQSHSRRKLSAFRRILRLAFCGWCRVEERVIGQAIVRYCIVCINFYVILMRTKLVAKARVKMLVSICVFTIMHHICPLCAGCDDDDDDDRSIARTIGHSALTHGRLGGSSVYV